jgi:hypothetical protein
MDIVSRTASRPAPRIRLSRTTVLRAAALALAAAATVAALGAAARPADRPTAPAAPAAPVVTTVTGGNAEARAAVDWALERYEAAELQALPPVEIKLHPSDAGCRGELGYYRAGRIDLCTAASSEPYAQKFALHELAHAWTAAHVGADLQGRFLELRDLDRWNTAGDAWKERGIEQAAEIIAWGLGEGEILPLLPEPATTAELVAAFELLTGEAPIAIG